MDAKQPANDQNKKPSLQEDTSSPPKGTQSQSSKRSNNSQGQIRPRTKLIVAGSIVLVLALIGTAINATVSVCRKGQEQIDDDNHPIRAMRDAVISSFTTAGQDKGLLKGLLELMIAETASAQGDYPKAHAYFEHVCNAYSSAFPDSYTYACILARVASFEYQFNKYKEAEGKFRDALKVFKKTDPNMHPFLTEEFLAYTMIEERKRKESLELSQQIFAEAKEVDKSHMGNAAHVLPALKLLAYAQISDKQKAEALATYTSIIALMDKQNDKPTPRSYAEIFVGMGDAQDDKDKKLASYNRAIAIDPRYARAYQYRAYLFEELHKSQDALSDLNRCIGLDSNDYWSYRERAEIFEGLHNYSAELKDINRCIELKPKQSWNYTSRAYVFKETRQLDKAISDLNEALRLEPSYDHARYRRGLLYKDLKHYEQAREDLSRVIRNQADRKSDSIDTWLAKHAYLERANIYDLMEKPELAKADRKLASQIKLSAPLEKEP